MSKIKLLCSIFIAAATLLSGNVQGQIIRPVEDHATMERGKVQHATANQPWQKNAAVVQADLKQQSETVDSTSLPPILTAGDINSAGDPNPLAPMPHAPIVNGPIHAAPINSISPVAIQNGRNEMLPPIVSGSVEGAVNETGLAPIVQSNSDIIVEVNPLAPMVDQNLEPATAQWPTQPYELAPQFQAQPTPIQADSSAPIYRTAQELPPIRPMSVNPNVGTGQRTFVPQATMPEGRQLPPITVGGSTAPPILSGVSISKPIQDGVQPAVQTPPIPQAVESNQATSPNGLAPQVAPMIDPQSNAPQSEYPESNYLDNSNIQAPSVYNETSALNGGCNACGNPNCNGNCATANYGGCSNCGDAGCADPNSVAARFGCSGSVTCARRYFHAEVLGWRFEDTAFQGTNAGGLGDFDTEVGWRTTIGRRFDATAGDEISYLGSRWDRSRAVDDPFGRLSAQFLVGIPFVTTNFNTFANATTQSESRDSDLHSVEYNRVKWGWDVVKTFWGIRGTYFRDRYNLTSMNAFGTGILEVDAKNFLIGPQWGGKLFYDVGYRTSYSLGLKIGADANFIELDTLVRNAGTNFVDNSSDTTNFSGHLELDGFAHYQLTPQARIRVGYNLLILWKMATATDNYPFILDSNAGGSIRDSEDLYFHGISGGIEIFR